MLQVILVDRLAESIEERCISVHRLLWHCFPDVAYDDWFRMGEDLVRTTIETLQQLHWELPEDLMDPMPDNDEAGRRMQQAWAMLKT